MTDDSLRVLLVEDNPGDVRLIEHHLRVGSYPDVADDLEVVQEASLEDGLAAVESESFDLVLLDLGLPESTGPETLDRFLPAVPHLPVVVLTGLDDSEVAVQAIQKGAQDYLPKDDVDSDTLMRTVRYAIERKKQERILRRQTEQMKFFNSILRHDVGNGMDVIRRNAQLLQTSLDGESRERAETILTWSDDLIELTGKVRHMLESVAGEADRDWQLVNLSTILRDRVAQFESMDSVTTVETEIPDNVVVRADEMLSEVFGNLLTNAVEHNDSDEPKLLVTVADGAEWVEVQIADNGPGIPDAQKERIFGRGETRHESGGGFGLYFVTTMVEGYGGEVSVTDNEPRGSVFEVRLPAA